MTALNYTNNRELKFLVENMDCRHVLKMVFRDLQLQQNILKSNAGSMVKYIQIRGARLSNFYDRQRSRNYIRWKSHTRITVKQIVMANYSRL